MLPDSTLRPRLFMHITLGGSCDKASFRERHFSGNLVSGRSHTLLGLPVRDISSRVTPYSWGVGVWGVYGQYLRLVSKYAYICVYIYLYM